MKVHLEILPERQKELLSFLTSQRWLKSFYLAGGSALALQICHRQSYDFDFFTNIDFNTKKVIYNLNEVGNFQLFDEEKNIIDGLFEGVKISFSAHKFSVLKPFIKYEQLNIADKLDIALMKLEAISGRANKKDFIDLYFLLHDYSLSELFEKYTLKYGKKISNIYHLLKSLVYFEDAENQPMPVMIRKVLWNDVKKYIISEVKNVVEKVKLL